MIECSPALLRLLNRPPKWLQEQDMRQLRGATEELTLVISNLTALGVQQAARVLKAPP